MRWRSLGSRIDILLPKIKKEIANSLPGKASLNQKTSPGAQQVTEPNLDPGGCSGFSWNPGSGREVDPTDGVLMRAVPSSASSCRLLQCVPQQIPTEILEWFCRIRDVSERAEAGSMRSVGGLAEAWLGPARNSRMREDPWPPAWPWPGRCTGGPWG